MKKIALIILTIVLVATMMLAFTGCASATIQDQLGDIWRPYEKYVYTVDGDGETGTYTVEIKRNSASTITIGDMTVENVKEGYIITGLLEIADKTYESACYMQKTNGSSLFVPIATYTKRPGAEAGYTTTIKGKYEGKNFNYTISEYGAPKEETIALKTPYYDNNQIHQLLRAVNSLGTNFSFNFYVPVADEGELAQTSASCSATADITWGDDTTTQCNKVILARQTKVTGASHELYYATKPIKINGYDLKNVLIRFKEPISNGQYIVYTLKSITLPTNA